MFFEVGCHSTAGEPGIRLPLPPSYHRKLAWALLNRGSVTAAER